MAVLASDIIKDAAGHLNDSTQIIWTDAKLLPSVQSAWRTFREELKQSSVPDSREEDETLVVTAGAVAFDTPPTGLIYPIRLSERQKDSELEFVPMKEVAFSPTFKQNQELRYWMWIKGAVRFIGALEDREVHIRFMQDLGEILSVNAAILVEEARSYLGWRTASHAAATVGEDYDRAAFLQTEAAGALQKYLSAAAREQQSQPARRRRYGYKNRRRLYV